MYTAADTMNGILSKTLSVDPLCKLLPHLVEGYHFEWLKSLSNVGWYVCNKWYRESSHMFVRYSVKLEK